MSKFKTLLSLALTPFAILIHGFVLSKVWAWFITPVFDVSAITTMQAAGIMFVVDFILLKIDWTDQIEKSSNQEFATKWISHALITPFVLLGFGYIISLFV